MVLWFMVEGLDILSELLFPSVLVITGFILLFKSAERFVDGSIGTAEHFKLPKMLTGIVLVAFATTAPEFTVSLIAAIKGHPEIALGNAVGSVICDDAVALGLAAFISASPILINKSLLHTSGIFLVGADLLAFLFAFNGTVSRPEGILLLIFLAVYFFTLYKNPSSETVTAAELHTSHDPRTTQHSVRKLIFELASGLIGIVIASEILIHGVTDICITFGIPEVIVGMTVVAIGTSLPEISTSITAARKGEGELAVGDIIGADILNVLWIIGASSTAVPIQVERRIILFAFPYMIFVVLTMLGFMMHKYRLTKMNGIILMTLYLIYMSLNIIFFSH